MGFAQWLGFSIINSLLLELGGFLVFFPGKGIKLRAKVQEDMLKPMGMSGDDIDRLPLFSSIFGENYSKRLRAKQKTPDKFRYFDVWTRIIGFFILFITLIKMSLILFSAITGKI